jgi:hypothetical protein
VNSTGVAGNTASGLDVDFTDKGILVPRVASTSRALWGHLTGASTNSMLVYNTATAGVVPNNVTPDYYYWQGAYWICLITNSDAWVVGTITGFFRYRHCWMKGNKVPMLHLRSCNIMKLYQK